MPEPARFAFTVTDETLGEASLLPYLPLTLTYRNRSVDVTGLLDTGSTVNVLPYRVGLELGAVWEQQTTSVQLTGNLAQVEARVLIVSGTVRPFPPTRLIFAWTQAENVPLLLGQINFFLEFDTCFYRSRAAFEVQPRQS